MEILEMSRENTILLVCDVQEEKHARPFKNTINYTATGLNLGELRMSSGSFERFWPFFTKTREP